MATTGNSQGEPRANHSLYGEAVKRDAGKNVEKHIQMGAKDSHGRIGPAVCGHGKRHYLKS
jgi:hypothetical protein